MRQGPGTSWHFPLIGVLIAFLLPAATFSEVTLLSSGTVADSIHVDKSERTLTLYRRGKPLKAYRVGLGPNPVGHKQQAGDGRTPEGRYRIDFHKYDSAFHRALHISYPNASDRASARKRGVSPGGDLMIHGRPKGSETLGTDGLAGDWTLGCIAVTNEEIEEIYRAVPNGTTIEIAP